MLVEKEEEYLNKLKQKLNSISPGWIFGDKEYSYLNKKSSDLVNHEKRLAIEVKDDLSEEVLEPTPENPFVSGGRNLSVLSNRYKHDIEDAHKKFKNYPNYETAVFIRSNCLGTVPIPYLLGGLIRLNPYGRIPNTDKNISRNCKNCSLFVFYNIRYNEIQFYKNPLSNRKQGKITKIVRQLSEKCIEITDKDFIS